MHNHVALLLSGHGNHVGTSPVIVTNPWQTKKRASKLPSLICRAESINDDVEETATCGAAAAVVPNIHGTHNAKPELCGARTPNFAVCRTSNMFSLASAL